jgi:hypothetical protein
VNGAARAGYGDKSFAEAADQLASVAACRLGERAQAAGACGARWTGRTRWSGRTDAATRTVGTGRARLPWRTLLSHRAWRSRRPLFSFGARGPLVAFLTLRSWRTRAEQTSGDEADNSDWFAHYLGSPCKTNLSPPYRSVKTPNFQLACSPFADSRRTNAEENRP